MEKNWGDTPSVTLIKKNKYRYFSVRPMSLKKKKKQNANKIKIFYNIYYWLHIAKNVLRKQHEWVQSSSFEAIRTQ